MPEYLELVITWLKIPAVQAVLCVIGSIIAAKLVDWIIGRILTHLVSKTTSTIDDKIIQIIHRPIYYSILAMGLGISVKLFPLPELITKHLRTHFGPTRSRQTLPNIYVFIRECKYQKKYTKIWQVFYTESTRRIYDSRIFDCVKRPSCKKNT